MATWNFTSPIVGLQAITTHSTTQQHPLGTVAKAQDATLGEAEFIYLKGIVGTVAGSVVVYDTVNFLSRLAPVGTNKPDPVAVSMAATVAGEYGWYQISGVATALKTSGLALASNAAVGVLTIGKVAATGTGKEIQGALTVAKATVPTAVNLIINRPHMQGRVT